MLGVGGETLHGLEAVAVGLRGEHQAGARRDTVEQDGASATDPVFAADMRSREQQIVADEIREQ